MRTSHRRALRCAWMAICFVVVAAPVWAACDAGAPSNTPASRYAIDGGTVYDTQTNLTWQRCSVGQHWSEDGGCVGSVQQLSWDDAQKQGVDGWRVPTMSELQTLISSSCSFPAINENVFPGMESGALWYWSSTPGPLVVAWGVGFGRGDPDQGWRTNVVSVRLVRNGR